MPRLVWNNGEHTSQTTVTNVKPGSMFLLNGLLYLRTRWTEGDHMYDIIAVEVCNGTRRSASSFQDGKVEHDFGPQSFSIEP